MKTALTPALSQADYWTQLTPWVKLAIIGSMRICGKYFNKEIIAWIQGTVQDEPYISRRELARRVCEWMNWRAQNGRFKEMSCRKALLELYRRGVVNLPESSMEYSFQKESGHRTTELPSVAELSCSLGELGEVEVVPVKSRYSKSSREWNVLMERFHYLGKGPLCGAQIRYLVKSSVYGCLGALSFSAGTWRLKDRDKWIGWSESARWANLSKVICNSRFLILPTVHIPNLGSRILSLCIKRLADDWEQRYGYRPVLLETFVDPQRFAGSCYKAANWIFVGQTAAEKGRYQNGKVSKGKKNIYLYPMVAQWQSKLCTEPEIALGSTPRPMEPSDWAEEEFGRVHLYDERLKRRLFILANDFLAQPGVLVAQACNGSIAKAKAAYRFFDNKEINMKRLLRPHVEATIERIKAQGVVLAVQDTTTLDYTAHMSTKGLGPTSKRKDKSVGLIMHDTMAFTIEGTPLGLLDVQCWARDPEKEGKRELRNNLPIEEKESIKWLNSYRAVCEVQKLCPETMLVSVGDREADIYELFHEAGKDKTGAKILVRAEKTRKRKVGNVYLWEEMEKKSVAGTQELYIPRKGSRPARTAKMEIRFDKVTLKPPRDKKLPPVTVWAVYAKEVDYSADVVSPLSWMLLTTVEVSTFEHAQERLAWYARRWGIEIYHRTVKSGCRIEDRCLENADRLEACLAIDLVVAWRIYYLTKQGRETPNVPCDIFLSEDEWRVLCSYVKKNRHLMNRPVFGMRYT
jgi:hypothetical protein